MRNFLLIVSICSISFPFIAYSQDAPLVTGWKNELQTGINLISLASVAIGKPVV